MGRRDCRCLVDRIHEGAGVIVETASEDGDTVVKTSVDDPATEPRCDLGRGHMAASATMAHKSTTEEGLYFSQGRVHVVPIPQQLC